MDDGDLEPEVGVVGNTGEHVVPREEGSRNAKGTTGQAEVGGDGVAGVLLAEGEEEEGQVEDNEETGKGDGGAEGEEGEEGGEDEPAVKVEGKDRVEAADARRLVGVRLDNAKSRGEDDAEGDPEATVGAERSGTEGVADGHLPHAGEELDETAVAVGERDDQVGLGDVEGADVDAREYKGGEGKGAETERGGVGDWRKGMSAVRSLRRCVHGHIRFFFSATFRWTPGLSSPPCAPARA